MLHHRTTNPATRAWHVAERESDDDVFGLGARHDGYLREFAEEAEKDTEAAETEEEKPC